MYRCTQDDILIELSLLQLAAIQGITLKASTLPLITFIQVKIKNTKKPFRRY